MRSAPYGIGSTPSPFSMLVSALGPCLVAITAITPLHTPISPLCGTWFPLHTLRAWALVRVYSLTCWCEQHADELLLGQVGGVDHESAVGWSLRGRLHGRTPRQTCINLAAHVILGMDYLNPRLLIRVDLC